jgi:hypothetical protein
LLDVRPMNARTCIAPVLAGLSLSLALTTSSVASADDSRTAPGFERRETNKEYTAPLSQTTQPSYVPQSVALSGPRQLDHHEGEPVPPGYTPVQRTRKGPIVAGAVVFGTLYLFSSAAAAAGADSAQHGGSNEVGALWIPVAGPFIQMGQTDSALGKYMLAIDGIGQAAGAALLAWGLTSPKTVLVRNDLTGWRPTIRATPIVTASTTGVGLTGTF